MFSCKGRKEEKLVQTLGFFVKDGKIWLGVKIGGKDFGRGRLNGFGGDLKEGETIEQAARREFKEESGLEVLRLEERAIIKFFFVSEPARVREVHVFWVSDCRGEPIGSEEMTVQSFSLEEVENLYPRMWPGDCLWLPMFLEGKRFQGRVVYDNPLDKKILSKEFFEIEGT